MHSNINETIITHSLFERKEIFLDMSDAFIVLPGGVGSMDELLEVMVSNQLGGINKPVGLLNINGYYDGFLSWLQHSVDEEFVSLENQNQVLVHVLCLFVVTIFYVLLSVFSYKCEISECSRIWRGIGEFSRVLLWKYSDVSHLLRQFASLSQHFVKGGRVECPKKQTLY